MLEMLFSSGLGVTLFSMKCQ